jgi:hypothetical protein
VTLRIIKNKKNLEVSPKYERLPIEKRNWRFGVHKFGNVIENDNQILKNSKEFMLKLTGQFLKTTSI